MNWKKAILEPDVTSTALWRRCGKPSLIKTLALAVAAVAIVDLVLITFSTLIAAAAH